MHACYLFFLTFSFLSLECMDVPPAPMGAPIQQDRKRSGSGESYKPMSGCAIIAPKPIKFTGSIVKPNHERSDSTRAQASDSDSETQSQPKTMMPKKIAGIDSPRSRSTSPAQASEEV